MSVLKREDRIVASNAAGTECCLFSCGEYISLETKVDPVTRRWHYTILTDENGTRISTESEFGSDWINSVRYCEIPARLWKNSRRMQRELFKKILF